MNPVVAITGQRRMNFSSGKIMNPSGKPAIVQNTTADGTYHVPKRFGMSGMLAITTLMAIIFGVIYNMGNLINDPLYAERGTHPLIFLFMGILILIMCLVQMACGDVPRVASITTGVILLPLFVAFAMLYLSGWKAFGMSIACSPFLMVAGALVGYLGGAITAGCFLVTDILESKYRPHTVRTTQTPNFAAWDSATEIVTAELVNKSSEIDYSFHIKRN
jgi:hypothetical protein